MVVFKLLTIFALVAVSKAGDRFGCEKVNEEAGAGIHSQCPEFAGMVGVDTELYPNCLEKEFNLPFIKAMEVCTSKNGEDPVTDPVKLIGVVCDPNAEEEGRKIICCMVTEEVKNTTRTGMDVYEMSDICIKRFQKAYPKDSKK